jgi:hypothetical protein
MEKQATGVLALVEGKKMHKRFFSKFILFYVNVVVVKYGVVRE